MAREDLHFRLRIPEEIKARIEQAASLNERSMTAEIISRLQWTLGPADEEFQELQGKLEESTDQVRELTWKVGFLEKDIALRREQLREEIQKGEVLRGDLAKEAGRGEAFKSAIEIMARAMEWSNGAASREILEVIEKLQPDQHGEK
ncbi:Arc family DNA-binding protein [Ensifer canadensis]|uniref:Arc family DNA-binding protein n=1 Tax=Ensifer canadensis TaxID=555315 RepID=UPI0035E3C4AD